MPFINVIRGETVPDSAFNVRTPVVRFPLWMVLFGMVLRGLYRLVVAYLRFWYVTIPATVLYGLWLRYGWWAPTSLVASLAAGLTGWFFLDRASFVRGVWWPLLGQVRLRWVYRRSWMPAMTTAKLAVTFDRHTVLPILKRVRCNGAADTLTVRMVTGQIPDDFAAAGERLMHTFGGLGFRVMPGDRPDQVRIVLRRSDPLTATVAPIPVVKVPDFTRLPLGLREDGEVYTLRLFGTQVLVVGATDAGKGSVIWSVVASVAGGIASGLVKVWAFDPKGGMELGGGRPLFDRFACEDFEGMADMLDELVAVMRERTTRLCGVTRQHIPTIDDPLYLVIIDELAALTAYTDRKIKDRIRASLGILLTQGRAVGVHILACLQDPRKEVLPFRNLFPTRIGLRLAEDSEVDLALGDGARDRGALCDRIPKGPTHAGTAYVVLDGDPTPMRVRFSYLTDDDIQTLTRTHGRLRVVDEAGAA